jgi:hypothetical protein
MGMNVGSQHLYSDVVRHVDKASEEILNNFLLTCRAKIQDPSNVRYVTSVLSFGNVSGDVAGSVAGSVADAFSLF